MQQLLHSSAPRFRLPALLLAGVQGIMLASWLTSAGPLLHGAQCWCTVMLQRLSLALVSLCGMPQAPMSTVPLDKHKAKRSGSCCWCTTYMYATRYAAWGILLPVMPMTGLLVRSCTPGSCPC
jgi:hypothetical protein